MEELIAKLVENTPVLAVLAVYILSSLKAQDRRDTEAAKERQQFLISYQQIANSLSDVALNVKNQCDAFQNFGESVMQAHQYQKIEHEQMIKFLERLNGKT